MKITTREDFRVQVTGTVYPQRLGDFGGIVLPDRMTSSDIESDYQRRCEDIVKALAEQHPHLKAEIVCDTREECSHCGLAWEVWTAQDADRYPDEPYVVGEPVCCEEGAAEFHTARARSN